MGRAKLALDRPGMGESAESLTSDTGDSLMRASDDAIPFSGGSFGLYDRSEYRKYLTNDERTAFLSAVEQEPRSAILREAAAQ